MIGQESLQKELFSQSLQYSRTSLLFVGEYGCGKHTLVKEYAKHLGLPLVDITADLSLELLETIQLSSILSMYLIDLDMLTEQSQNMVLKFIEEPSDAAYVVLICSSENKVIPTILNRCSKYKFANYSKEELISILGEEVSDEVLDVCTTPGQVRLVQNYYAELKVLCETIVNKLAKSALSNALSISTKINYKDEYDKFDLSIFLRVLSKAYYQSYIDGHEESLKLYNIVCMESQKLIDFRLNKELFILHLLTLLWKESRGKIL